MGEGLADAGGEADVVEAGLSAGCALVVEEDVGGAGEAAGAAHDGCALPHAARFGSRSGGGGEVEVDVVGDDEIEAAVAVVVEEGAACAPLFAGARGAGFG